MKYYKTKNFVIKVYLGNAIVFGPSDKFDIDLDGNYISMRLARKELEFNDEDIPIVFDDNGEPIYSEEEVVDMIYRTREDYIDEIMQKVNEIAEDADRDEIMDVEGFIREIIEDTNFMIPPHHD